jgi:hypothetical protein
MHHRTIQINHQPDATIFQFIILTFVYSSTCFGWYVTVKSKVASKLICIPYNNGYKGTSLPFDYFEIIQKTYKMLYKYKYIFKGAGL